MDYTKLEARDKRHETRGPRQEAADRALVRNPSVVPLLTEREWAVLELVAACLSYKEIAIALNISHSTVKNHLSNIRERLRARNSLEAVLTAYERSPGIGQKSYSLPKSTLL